MCLTKCNSSAASIVGDGEDDESDNDAADGMDEAGAEGDAVAQPKAGEADNGVHAMDQTEETDNGAHAMDQNDAAADEAFDSG